jgi:hypothetical protein
MRSGDEERGPLPAAQGPASTRPVTTVSPGDSEHERLESSVPRLDMEQGTFGLALDPDLPSVDEPSASQETHALSDIVVAYPASTAAVIGVPVEGVIGGQQILMGHPTDGAAYHVNPTAVSTYAAMWQLPTMDEIRQGPTMVCAPPISRPTQQCAGVF